MVDLTAEILKLQGPIVVFGAGGFIGANLFRMIRDVRPDCFAVTHQRYVPWRLRDLPDGAVLRADVTVEEDVQRLFRHYRFQTVFCLSAYGAYSRQKRADQIYRTNLQGLLNILTAAEEQGFAALVHTGSSSEYGLNCAGPREDDRKRPNSHYAVSKVAASYLLEHVAAERKLPVMNLRLYSAYGPWEETDRLVPRLIECGMRGKLPPLVEPDISRDFVYVADVVEAMVLAATRGVKTHPGLSLNIGTGKRTTIREIAELSRDIFGIDEVPAWGNMPNRGWDLKDWYSNPELASEVLGWKATTELKRGLELTRNWTASRQGTLPEAHSALTHMPVRLSAVIAAYKDAQAIPIMHERLVKVFRELGVDYEILFVNDASPDDTDSVLQRLCREDRRVIAVEHSRNFGSQSAFLSGMEVSTGDAVVLLDGDLQDPPEVIAEFYREWRQGAEIVYGRRVRREASVVMQVCYKAFYRLFQKLAYIPIPLDAGDFSLLDRKVVSKLLSLPETDQFLRGLRAWVGFRQVGVDYVRPERMFGRSTNNWRKNFWWARKAIFSFSYAPLEMMLYAGVTLTAFAFLALMGQVAYRLVNPDIPHGITTIIILVLFFGGVQMLGLSMLGEYLGKVVEETKRRPKFIRRSIRSGDRHLTASEEIDGFVRKRQGRLGMGLGET